MANCDGAEVTIRPIAPGDFAIEKRFIAGLSTTSYRRLLSPRTPQDAEIARCTDIVRTREAARIAVTDADGVGPMCGVARYVRDGKSAARTIVLAVQGRDMGSARRCSSGASRARVARGSSASPMRRSRTTSHAARRTHARSYEPRHSTMR